MSNKAAHTLIKTIAGFASAAFAFAPMLAYAVPVVNVTSLTPGYSVNSGQALTFTLTSAGLSSGSTPTYLVFDDANTTSLTSSAINATTGVFSWTPTDIDKGVHNLTLEATDGTGLVAMKTIAIGVGVAAPTTNTTTTTTTSGSSNLAIQSLSPGGSVTVGQGVSFLAVTSGFTAISFTVGDSYSGSSSSITNGNISSTGAFSWVPKTSDIGNHSITVTAINAAGSTATQTVSVQVSAASASTPTTTTTTTTATPTVTAPAVTTTTITPSGVASFTSIQIQAIVALLQAFGASSSVVNQVSAILSGTAAVSTSPAVSSASGGYVFTTLLEVGSTGTAVTELQKKLTALGYYTGPINGSFGASTKAAVMKLQAASGLSQAGYTGPATRAILNQ